MDWAAVAGIVVIDEMRHRGEGQEAGSCWLVAEGPEGMSKPYGGGPRPISIPSFRGTNSVQRYT